MKILVVDDDSTARMLLERMFKKHSVISIATASGARELLRNEKFDLVIIDILLRFELGYSIVTYVREALHIRDTSMMFYSAIVNADHIEGIPFIPKGEVGKLRKTVNEIDENKQQILI